MLPLQPNAIRCVFVSESESIAPLHLRSAWLPFEAACALEGAIDVVGALQQRQVVVVLPEAYADESYEVRGGASAAKERILRLKEVIKKNHPDEKRVDADRLVQWALRCGLLPPDAEVAKLRLGTAKARKLYRPMDQREIAHLELAPPATHTKRKHQGKGSASSKKREHILRAFVHELAKRWGSYDECIRREGVNTTVDVPKLADVIHDRRFGYPTPLGRREEGDDGNAREATYGYGHNAILQIIRWVIHDTKYPAAKATAREFALKVVLRYLLANWGDQSIDIRSSRSQAHGIITECSTDTLATNAHEMAKNVLQDAAFGYDISVFVAVLRDLNQRN